MLSLLLRDAGAEVVVYAHADETDDAVAEALRSAGLTVFASSTATPAEQKQLALAMLDTAPHILLDDGSHVIRLAHQERPDLLPTMLGAAEETTSGLRPLRVLAARGELGIPVVAVNDARTKTFFDNRYGTGQSTVFAVLDLVDVLRVRHTPRRYGRRGGRRRFRARRRGGRPGAHRPRVPGDGRRDRSGPRPAGAVRRVRRGPARRGGARRRPRDERHRGAGHHRPRGAPCLRGRCGPGRRRRGRPGDRHRRRPRRRGPAPGRGPKAERFVFPGADGGPIVLDDGGCINITAAEGNPVEIMDLSFAVQLGAVRMLLERGDELERAVVPIDPAVDDVTARAALAAFGSRPVPPGLPAEHPADREPDVRTHRFGDPA